jgi:hypothetical protein
MAEPLTLPILVDQLTLFQPRGGAGYAHHITTGTSYFFLPSVVFSRFLVGSHMIFSLLPQEIYRKYKMKKMFL